MKYSYHICLHFKDLCLEFHVLAALGNTGQIIHLHFIHHFILFHSSLLLFHILLLFQNSRRSRLFTTLLCFNMGFLTSNHLIFLLLLNITNIMSTASSSTHSAAVCVFHSWLWRIVRSTVLWVTCSVSIRLSVVIFQGCIKTTSMAVLIWSWATPHLSPLRQDLRWQKESLFSLSCFCASPDYPVINHMIFVNTLVFWVFQSLVFNPPFRANLVCLCYENTQWIWTW